MTQIIQHKRRIGAGATGGPATLAAGELAVNANGVSLHVGVDAVGTVAQLVGVERQLEINAGSPVQTVLGGAKTFGLPQLKIPGGNVGEFLSLSAADGTLVYAPAVTAAQQFIGSLDATADTVTLTAQAGGGAVLPAAAAANGWYVICDTAGTLAAASASGAPAGDYQIGDWVISNGTAWNHLEFGGIDSVTAADVGVAPTVAGASNVQDALEALALADGNFVVGPATSLADTIALYTDATGLLIKQGPAISSLATTAYVDTENTTQDTIINANAAFIALQPGIDLAQDALIAAAGDVNGTTVSVLDHIATYSDATGKNIKDGAILASDIALLSDLTGLGDVVGPASVAATLNIAVYSGLTGKLIADGGKTVAALDTAVNNKITKPVSAAAIGNIATYADLTGGVAADGGRTIAQLDTAIAAKGDVSSTGATFTVNNLAAFSTTGGKNIVDTGQSIASIQAYVDGAIAAIPGAVPPLVTAPELTGDGSLATPITFAGMTVATNSLTSFVNVAGLAAELDLVLVDGGTY